MVKSIYFPILLFAVFLSELGNFIEMSAVVPEAVNLGMKIRFLGVPFIPTLWYLCIREFCGLKFKIRYYFPLFLAVPFLLSILFITWESNGLLVTGMITLKDGLPGNPTLVHGPLFPLRNAYQYGIDLLGLYTLLTHFRSGTQRFKKQMVLFIVSALIPFSNTLTYIVPIGGYNVDVTHYSLVLFMVLFSYCLYRFGVINRRAIIRDNVFQQINEGVLLFDHENIYMDSNKAARQVFPELEQTALGTALSEMEFLPFRPATSEDCGCDPNTTEVSLEKDGTVRTFAVSCAPIALKRKPISRSIIMNDISPLKRAMNELEERSYRDALTGLYNRGYLFAFGEKLMEHFHRSGSQFSAVLFDIDHFKRVNDTHGHLFGDFVLREMSRICKTDSRQSDVFGRYGGEEFCLLLVDTPLENAIQKAEYLRSRIEEHVFEDADVRMDITASFGVSSCNQCFHGDGFAVLVNKADERLYKAKEGGRNRVCWQ